MEEIDTIVYSPKFEYINLKELDDSSLVSKLYVDEKLTQEDIRK
jgi:hypothetical protein